jgi:pimeloyl-ACP methyl ester carboxylesterase
MTSPAESSIMTATVEAAQSVTGHGVTIRYDDLGSPDGVPVLLVHGHPFNRSMWDPQSRALSRAGYRVIAADLRGYGDSDVAQGKTLLSDFAQDLAAVLDHLGLQRAVIVGLSMGGQIAMEFHRLYRTRVLALVLADTSPIADTDEGKAFRNALADRLLAEGMDGYAAEVIDKMIAPYHVTGLPNVAEHVLGMMRTTAPEGAAAALRGRAERPDYRAMLPDVRVPTLIVVGADDPYTPVDQAELMHQLIADSTLTVIGHAAHLPNLEQPARFNAALLQFLDAHQPAITEPHPLLAYFLDAVDGRFPPADGGVTVVPALTRRLECSVAFTGHAVIATALPAADIHTYKPDGFGASLAPDFLRYLAGPTGWIGVIDATLAGRGTGGTPRLQPFADADEHPRVGHARQLRTNVRVFGDERGLITLAHGLTGRSELSIELHRPHDGSHGHGRSLLTDALSLVPDGEPVFAAVSPGNARSLRAFLATGFTPIGAEVLLRPDRAAPPASMTPAPQP